MNISQIAIAAAHLDIEQKIRLAARLSFELTFAARDTYVPGTDEIAAPRQIRAYNEMQHRVSACLCELLENRASELWFWQTISEWAKMAGAEAAATLACVRAFEGVAN